MLLIQEAWLFKGRGLGKGRGLFKGVVLILIDFIYFCVRGVIFVIVFFYFIFLKFFLRMYHF